MLEIENNYPHITGEGLLFMTKVFSFADTIREPLNDSRTMEPGNTIRCLHTNIDLTEEELLIMKLMFPRMQYEISP